MDKINKKIMCPYCSHVFEGQEDKYEASCPQCRKIFPFESGQKMYQTTIARFLLSANSKLYKSGDYSLSYSYYKSAFEMNEELLEALLGMVESLFCTSTLSECHIKDAVDLLETKSSQFEINEANASSIGDTMHRLNKLCDYFVEQAKANLADNDEKFYENIGLEYYKIILSQAILFKKEYLDIIELFGDEFKDYVYEENIDSIKENMKNFTSESKANFIVYPTDGSSLRMSLFSENPKLRIKSIVFPDNTKNYKLKAFSLALICFFGGGLITGLILLFPLGNNYLPGILTSVISLFPLCGSYIFYLLINKKSLTIVDLAS